MSQHLVQVTRQVGGNTEVGPLDLASAEQLAIQIAQQPDIKRVSIEDYQRDEVPPKAGETILAGESVRVAVEQLGGQFVQEGVWSPPSPRVPIESIAFHAERCAERVKSGHALAPGLVALPGGEWRTLLSIIRQSEIAAERSP